MKQKFFIAPKAVKISTGIIASILVASGMLAIFYAANQTIPYSQNLKSNQNVAKSNGAFFSGEDYINVANSPENLTKRGYLQGAYHIALKNGLIGKSTVSRSEIEKFLVELDAAPKTAPTISSVFEQDRIANEMETLSEAILEKSDLLDFEKPEHFLLKQRIFETVSTIAYSMDSQGTFDAALTRARASNNILKRVYDFQVNTVATPTQKDHLIQKCFPKLRKQIDMAYVFRFEYFRIQKMIEVANGIGAIDPKSEVFRKPKPFSFTQRLMLHIPGVEAAWQSRFNQIYAFVIAKCDQSVPHPLSDADAMGVTCNELFMNNKNRDYIELYGVNLPSYMIEFNHKNRYISLIENKRTSDHSIIVAALNPL